MRSSVFVSAAIFGVFQVRAANYGKTMVDKYDDLGPTLGVGPPPVLIKDGSLVYNNFQYVTQGGAAVQVGGVHPSSGKNVALVTIGTADASMATSGGCFDLKSFEFGCTTRNVQAELNVPLKCRVTLIAFDRHNKQIETQVVEFTPNGEPLSSMDHAKITLPPAKLIRVEAAILDLPPNLGMATTASLFDDMMYVEYDETSSICG